MADGTNGARPMLANPRVSGLSHCLPGLWYLQGLSLTFQDCYGTVQCVCQDIKFNSGIWIKFWSFQNKLVLNPVTVTTKEKEIIKKVLSFRFPQDSQEETFY